MKLTHQDYKVAWICALPLEMAAAKAMLNEVHDSLSQPATDHNAYTLGSTAGHNIAIACLPAGVYGTTSAATVLSHMLPTFPGLRFALMVGIGGGVPSKSADIRLGDVVVSLPTAMYPGVIQYDYGKTLRDGQFHRTGSLNKPPQFLLTAISQIRSNGMMGNSHLTDIISDTLERHDNMQQSFSRPNDDWLFVPSYTQLDRNPDCLACDPSYLVERSPRPTQEPDIHYGLIASGNQVMKDATTRDSIAQQFGILCFEMEAAGIMGQLPCLVIRGICDYCDSHKHKQWQGYAALVSAAYARTLLLEVPTHSDNVSRNQQTGHWMVPFDQNTRFMGREDIIANLDEWLTQQTRPTKMAIHGLGGVGKTQIALEVAYRMRNKYPNLSIFWIPCTSYESVDQAYVNVAQKFGIPGVKPEDVKQAVSNYLSQESAGEWLLIFDNADDSDMWINGSSAPALKKFLPRSQQGHILFTTRNRTLALKLASPHLIEIPEPDQDISLSILESLIDSDLLVEKDAALRLLEQLAYLPLAITQAASYIQENQISISKYLHLLEGNESQTIDLLSEDFEDEGRYDTIQNPVATTWWISFQHIQELNDLAIEYLSFMACINPREIPTSLLPQRRSENEKTKAIGLLKAYSFVTEQAGRKFLSLHRLVHLTTRSWMKNIGMFRAHVLKTADQFSDVFPDRDISCRKLWREYLPHVLLLIKEDDFLEKQHEYTQMIRRIGSCLSEDGRYNEAEKLIHQVLNIHQRDLGPENLQTLETMADLALIYWYQGRWKKAEELGVQVLKARTQILGFGHPDTLLSMANLASTYLKQGRWQEAEELQIEVLTAYKEILGFEHPNTLLSMSILASIYSNQDRRKQAEEIEVQVFKTRREILGLKHPSTLLSMSNLASIYSNQDRWKEAEEIGVQVFKTRREMIGLENSSTLLSMANLASTYYKQGRWTEAEQLDIKVLWLQKQVIGPEHPDTLITMHNLAFIWHSLGKASDALALMKQCVHLRNKVLGHQHPHTISSTKALDDWIEESNTSPRQYLPASNQEKNDRHAHKIPKAVVDS
ncbi:hypothetical protein ASPCADRAFT_156291 [Aspergillus carbonarius ITEM 5010]|uniref:NB-ARC domain-containing protein n=1 Tax=Aspergillus carbonarius (strain ITEM 5010) TaxID=602072 RepID=A0A1R3R857_ASPC5|nr:hypothetical protein ASPCADRAFT_156291 [Aspergillus carbonarius ITEM 5010]